MSRIVDVLKFITSHSLARNARVQAVTRFFSWQLGSRPLNVPVLIPFVNDTNLFAHKGIHSVTGNYYVGLVSFEEMSFLLHFLREDETFVDVEANIGAFTVLVSGVCRARCFAFEPARVSYEWMIMNLRINGLGDRAQTFQVAVGAKTEVVRFVENSDSVKLCA